MKKHFCKLIALGLFVAMAQTGCDDTDETRFTLSKAVDNPVTVTLSVTGSLATVQLVRINDLPVEPRAELLELLGREISLIVTDLSSGTTANLLDGQRVDTPPAAPGQYRLSLVEDMSALMVVFYNETIAGSSLKVGGDYTAALTVSANDFFLPQSFTRQVEVK
ncbi:MAG: hypothetical protein MUC50_00685 [Myxococcota bacterium]|jgi:hypothetical protein|nr:hypothetical protein [Myxococcota bacterium]